MSRSKQTYLNVMLNSPVYVPVYRNTGKYVEKITHTHDCVFLVPLGRQSFPKHGQFVFNIAANEQFTMY